MRLGQTSAGVYPAVREVRLWMMIMKPISQFTVAFVPLTCPIASYMSLKISALFVSKLFFIQPLKHELFLDT